MKITAFIGVVGFCLTMAEAGTSKDSNDSPTPLPTMPEGDLEPTQEYIQEDVLPPATKEQQDQLKASPKIPYDQMEPFEQPEPNQVTEKAAIKFKPQLNIANGECYPYPAVNEAGQVSTGLPKASSECGKPKLGSQVYGRSAWFGRVWAMMYSWYFPAHKKADWEHIIVWTNNPNVTDQTILAVTTSASGEYTSQVPPHARKVSGKSVKVSYSNELLASTTSGGEFQDLIMWHQLCVVAQESLNDDQSFDGVQVPFNDDYFLLNLGKAWPFQE